MELDAGLQGSGIGSSVFSLMEKFGLVFMKVNAGRSYRILTQDLQAILVSFYNNIAHRENDLIFNPY